jgi:hypothetical protein
VPVSGGIYTKRTVVTVLTTLNNVFTEMNLSAGLNSPGDG